MEPKINTNKIKVDSSRAHYILTLCIIEQGVKTVELSLYLGSLLSVDEDDELDIARPINCGKIHPTS